MHADPLVVVTFPGFEPEREPAAAILRAAGARITLAPKTGARSPVEVTTLLAGATGAIVSTDPFDAAVLEALPDLRVIARVGVGTDSIDLRAARERGVLVTTTPGANRRSVAEHAIALMLATLRRIAEHDRRVRAGAWERVGSMLGGELAGRTIGIVGYGAIGQAVRARLAGFEVDVIAHDPATGTADVPLVPLDELLARANVLTIHAPLHAGTRGLIGTAELARLPAGAVVVSTARGGIIDEAALLAAIDAGHVAGAGLDVFEVEPPIDSPLLAEPRVVLTPHVAGLSDVALAEMLERAAHSVAAVLAGHVPADVVDAQAMEVTA